MRILFIVILLSCISGIFAQTDNITFPNLSGAYLGQNPPGLEPQMFAPGIINTGMNERDVAVSPDGTEIFYGLNAGRVVTIMHTRLINGKWSEPVVAPFASDQNFFFFEPCLTAEGNRIYFLTNRPPKGKQPQPGWTYQNIWAADKKEDGSWGEPYDPDTLLNSNGFQYFPSITNNGTLYFTKVDPQIKKPAIYRCKSINGKLQSAEKLPDIINNNGEPFNAFIAHDESYLITCVDKKPNPLNPGRTNYYIYFRDEKDAWSEGKLLGPEINIKGSNAMSAYVSPDGKYFFFAAQKTDEKFASAPSPKTLGYYKELFQSPANGNYDIYWVDSAILTKYKERSK